MPSSRPSLAELLHQPVRWRIVQALIGRTLTTAELAEHLPDVAATTLYRHVSVLVQAGVLTVVAERRIRGTVERTYAIGSGASDEGAEGVDPEQLRTMFTVFVAGLAGDLDRYLSREQIAPEHDGIAFRQSALLLSDEEFTEFVTALGQLLTRFSSNEPAPGRTRRIVSTVLMPDG
ncbi:helix-turn-helix domain-containing protein [Nocardia sp. NPDC051756]|uniref:helix-turn-helix domain-containing protein n=1 Tax=Nocardia sp. NPDC051756 TaxID=3154751 RepID=UPI003429BE7D